MENYACIAVDAMGGDFGTEVTIPASVRLLSQYNDIKLLLFGDESKIAAKLSRLNCDKSRIKIIHTSDTISSTDSPSSVLRSRVKSSMHLALEAVANGDACACVSAGNTGALMVLSRMILKTLPGIDRPAILFPMPTLTGSVYMLDLGANVDCTANHLVQFAVMGSVLFKSLNNKKPKLALLNIGHESIKGTQAIKEAAEIISEYKDELGYVGFIEADSMYEGHVDVVVCDGFVGNVALKASEGVAKMIMRTIKQQFSSKWYAKIIGLLAKPVMGAVKDKFDINNYNGASLLGLTGVVIKSHGGATEDAFYQALLRSVDEAKMQVPEKIGDYLSKIIKELN